ncbi:hypothetical protein F5Y07DRAFT_267063 [Xylaria sp. FL0933]|nr:hypothetical protein F5Y07DRAFT_267063 [Xylaria sp. FL0933]
MSSSSNNNTNSTPPMSNTELNIDSNDILPQIEALTAKMHSNRDNSFYEKLPFEFSPTTVPALTRLALWMGLDDAFDAVKVLGEPAILRSFEAHRAAPGQHSVVEDPERLKLVLPLYKSSRGAIMQQRGSNIDVSAALFAHEVVRYLEREAWIEGVDLRPICKNLDEGFDQGKYSWAVALQIYWFLEHSQACGGSDLRVLE